MPSRTGRSGTILVIGMACVASLGCNRRLLSLVFDVPDRPARVAASPVQAVQLPEWLVTDEDSIRPPIEATLDPDSAVALLPRDHAGNIDWMEALRTEVIKPRSAAPGRVPVDRPGSFRFGFDFFFPGPNETFDAYFPHSAHTEWLDCRQCHSRIFKYRGTEIKMADVFAGKFCGECHGKVAFPVLTACERCHTTLEQPADRAKPDLLGTLVMSRISGSNPDSSILGNATGVRTNAFPLAVFPHWVHRTRYRCKSCHMELFEPRNGANLITMADIAEGRACGTCHNGNTAFAANFGECERCHVPPEPAEPPGAAPGQ